MGGLFQNIATVTWFGPQVRGFAGVSPADPASCKLLTSEPANLRSEVCLRVREDLENRFAIGRRQMREIGAGVGAAQNLKKTTIHMILDR
jgi:hypothetical protein